MNQNSPLRTVYFPYKRIAGLSTEHLMKLDALISSLKLSHYTVAYYTFNEREYRNIDLITCDIVTSYLFETNKIQYIDDEFFVKYLYNSLNNILVIDAGDYNQAENEYYNKYSDTSLIKWGNYTNEFDFIVKKLTNTDIINPWFITARFIEDNTILFVGGIGEAENREIKEYLDNNSAQKVEYIDPNYIDKNLTYEEYFAYHRPDISKALLNKYGSSIVSQTIKYLFNLQHVHEPVLIKFTGKVYEANNRDIYSYSISIIDSIVPAFQQVEEFISNSCHYSVNRFVLARVVPSDDLPFDFDSGDGLEEELYQASKKFSSELLDKLNELSIPRAKEELAKVMLKLMVADKKTNLLALSDSTAEYEPQLSNLIINSRYHIFLEDYNNIEIKMGALPKALYLLFLRYPNGIYLKNIANYKDELFFLYLKVTNQTDTEKLKHNIELLTDLQDDSIYVNLSRIKSAFVNVISDTYAKNYYPKGVRYGSKKVSLPQALIQLPQSLTSPKGLFPLR